MAENAHNHEQTGCALHELVFAYHWQLIHTWSMVASLLTVSAMVILSLKCELHQWWMVAEVWRRKSGKTTRPQIFTYCRVSTALAV